MFSVELENMVSCGFNYTSTLKVLRRHFEHKVRLNFILKQYKTKSIKNKMATWILSHEPKGHCGAFIIPKNLLNWTLFALKHNIIKTKYMKFDEGCGISLILDTFTSRQFGLIYQASLFEEQWLAHCWSKFLLFPSWNGSLFGFFIYHFFFLLLLSFLSILHESTNQSVLLKTRSP